MNETEIRKYAALMQELGLSGLEITKGSDTLRLERSLQASVAAAPSAPPEASPKASPEPKDYISVKSPIVGVFYAGPADNAPPYVSVGDTVTKGQTLCIIEAMKLMNEISAEEDGVIKEICVHNGQIVEYGTELFRIGKKL